MSRVCRGKKMTEETGRVCPGKLCLVLEENDALGSHACLDYCIITEPNSIREERGLGEGGGL